MKKMIIALIIGLGIIVITTVIKYYLDQNKTMILDLNYEDSAQTLTNPQRGFYRIYGYLVEDDSQ
ncbi:MAG TPA: hypothetical protein DHN33_04295, partial [Eubacteriaceae bacterium]|nr:hypothetical protein [Eubacteriaceae bacterium]